MHTEQYKKIIMPIILKHLPKTRVILYGSRARNDAHEGSDIDIALDTGNKIAFDILTTIIGEVEESNLPINFDIVDFNALFQKMQKKIIKDGVLWQP